MTPLSFQSWLSLSERPTLVMGVLNVTPDSFSDGGKFLRADEARRHAVEMIEQGADLIDVGGESTRPGATRVSDAEQIARVVPVIEAIAPLGAAISIDTTRSAVAQAAIDAGASIINDISAGREDSELFYLAARRKVPVILMHMQGQPGNMQENPTYSDVVQEVYDFLTTRAGVAQRAGVPVNHILIDPGIGFGKSLEHNLLLLKRLDRLVETGFPVVLGTSRKGFIGKITNEPDPERRQFGTAATVAWAVSNRCGIVRVHDVRAMKQVATVLSAILEAKETKER